MSADHDPSRAPAYAACFRAIVEAMREGCGAGCDLLFDYNSAASIRRDRGMLEAGYPGDGHVDIVSIEAYDGYGPQGDPQARWRAQREVLDYIRDFGARRGKHLAFPEWGVWNEALGPSSNANGGGDNGHHVEMICRYAKDPANGVYYLVYFNGSGVYPWHDLRRNPNAMAAFRQHCRFEAPVELTADGIFRP